MLFLRKNNAESYPAYSRIFTAGILLLTLLLSACLPQAAEPAATAAPTPPGTYAVDTLFREYYRDLGGEPVLGPAISSLFKHDNRQCQYTANTMMCYDPAATDNGRYTLEPLGRQMGIFDEPGDNPEARSPRVVDGYAINPGFIGTYDALRGAVNIGKPLTEARYNYEQQRVEQYFENVGFYYQFDDPPGNVHLLPYGVFFCGQDCTYQTDFSKRFFPGKQEIEVPFAPTLEKMGGLKIFGQPLSKPYLAKDGNMEQVYENVVVFAPAKKLTEAKLRPLPILLGMTSVQPGPKKFDQTQNVTFYEVKSGLGYHVPVVFDQFIQQYGGKAVSGDPIADPLFYANNLPRQCFQNFCLDYHPSSAADLQVRLAPLGIKYLEKVSPKNIIGQSAVPKDVVILLKKEKQQVPSQDTQTIQVQVLQKADNKPLANIEPKLTLMTPDGAEFMYYLPATGPDGRAGMVIPAMEKLPNGSLVIYRVCVEIPGAAQACERDAYLIWNGK